MDCIVQVISISAHIRLDSLPVFIPVFPGTNCEYDSKKAFERAGAKVITKVFKNLNAEDIRDSVAEFEKAIAQSQMIMFPGGFSAGDEPDGSAKFFATAFQNAKLKEAVEKLLHERDGLALGICNGFQALIKLGLVPYGNDLWTDREFSDIDIQHDRTPYFQDGIHKSRNKQITMAAAGRTWRSLHKSGIPRRRSLCSFRRVCLKQLFANGQVATQYCDLDGTVINGRGMESQMVLTVRSKESQVRMDVCLVRWLTQNEDGKSVAVNIYGEQDLKIFESGVAYFK